MLSSLPHSEFASAVPRGPPQHRFFQTLTAEYPMSLLALAPDVSLGLDINLFVLKEGRLPKLGDDVHPWQYRGWLLWQVQLADHHPMLPHRWDHYMRTFEAGHLLDEGIPEIR